MNIEFGIVALEPKYIILGHVYSGIVRCGIRFHSAYRLEHKSFDVSPLRVLAARIDLAVVRIECYGRSIDQLDEGLTGLLVVEGHGIELLSAGMSIGSSSDSPTPTTE